MHFHPAIAPVKVGILPLSKKLNEGAEKIYHELRRFITANLMTEEISVRDTAVRTRLVLLTVLRMTLIL